MMRLRDTALTSFVFCLPATAASAGNSTSYLGPDEYTSTADSPFEVGVFAFCIEDFEDNAFTIPRATGNASVIGAGGLTDSVDADDGSIDGSGTGGHSYFSGSGSIEIAFDLDRPNGLPTSLGVVWTDGGLGAPVTFEAFGPDNQSVLPVPHGPFVHADLSNSGETPEDRFYGVESASGIRRFVISNTGGGIEIDHIQLNRCVLCGDANFDLRITAPDALFALKASVGSELCRLCVCDTNDNEDNSVTDALAILRKSVGQNPPMNCPGCLDLGDPL